jgi:hypothetical protein
MSKITTDRTNWSIYGGIHDFIFIFVVWINSKDIIYLLLTVYCGKYFKKNTKFF